MPDRCRIQARFFFERQQKECASAAGPLRRASPNTSRRRHPAHIAQVVEHSLGKGEVTGSSPVMGTIFVANDEIVIPKALNLENG